MIQLAPPSHQSFYDNWPLRVKRGGCI